MRIINRLFANTDNPRGTPSPPTTRLLSTQTETCSFHSKKRKYHLWKKMQSNKIKKITKNLKQQDTLVSTLPVASVQNQYVIPRNPKIN